MTLAYSSSTPSVDADVRAGDATEPAGPSGAVNDRLPDARALRSENPAAAGDIVVLVGPGEIPAMMVHALGTHFGAVTVIEEDKVPASAMIKRRLRMLGPVQAAGQAAFGVFLKFAAKRSAARRRAIIAAHNLSTGRLEGSARYRVATVNSPECIALLAALKPRVVVVVGTRMIRAGALGATDAPVINYHAGLNPAYRGMNGGYWALANGDPAGAGMTVHLVDAGVDTGAALYWSRFKPEAGDSFTTYPLLQAAHARPLLIGAVRDALDDQLDPQDVALDSRQWFHPTLWGYLWTGLTRGVW